MAARLYLYQAVPNRTVPKPWVIAVWVTVVTSDTHDSPYIIAWNVAGELHIPKNITVGSKSPQLVVNAPFHWSPSLIRMLL